MIFEKKKTKEKEPNKNDQSTQYFYTRWISKIRLPISECKGRVKEKFNSSIKKYYINLTVLLKNIDCDSVEKNLNIQLKNSTQSISLELIQFNKTQMNNRDVMIALYEIDSRSLDLLKKYSLKTLFFTMQSKTYGSTIIENNNLFINQLKCF